ncbi:hypothetical protein GCK32_001018 [Trichostrongylus colubriformis]|uniref:G-protein coupled receptors family 1 profile domain-containing protein n=1 Tax=Trichostrongylus colubriformis TaxID=6319 RepID=A0AAN8EX81_TRICO
MVHRYRMMKDGQMSTTGLLLILAVVVILPALLMILPYINPPNFHIIMEETIREHASLNPEKYGEFGGTPAPSDPFQATSSIISLVTAVTCPILMLYIRRLILKTLSSSYHQYTSKTVHSSRMFLKALTVQAMVPILCFMPINVRMHSNEIHCIYSTRQQSLVLWR